MTSSSYFRYPHVHGDLVTFVAEDDVWVAPLAGGRAWRVSSLQLPARNPRFSPDGQHLAWSVVQASAPEAVTASVDGGGFRQLTYWGHPSTKVKGFTPGGDALVTSSFEREESRHTWAYAVPLDGSDARALPYGPVDSIAFGPELGDERPVVVGSVLSREPAWWKRYRGGTAGKLWIDRDGGGEFGRLAAELDGNLADPMWIGNRIAFLSDHEGYGNLYSVQPDGTGLRRHTDHDGFYVRHAATDGTRVVFESAGELWLLDSLDSPDAAPRRLEITLGSASTGRRSRPLDVAKHLASAVPNPKGTASVIETHGTVHWLTHRDGPSRAVESTPGVRARLARPLGDTRVVYVADHDGEEALYIRQVFEQLSRADQPAPAAAAPAPAEPEPDGLPRPVSASAVVHPTQSQPIVEVRSGGRQGGGGTGGGEPDARSAEALQPQQLRRVELPGPDRVSALAASPDGRLAAAATEYGQVLVLDTDTAQLRRLSGTDHGAVSELAFSPDSRWILWAEPVTAEGTRTRLRLARADGTGGIVDVTDGRFRDHGPAFTPDGKFAAFLSERSFDPVYSTHSFDLGFPESTKPFLVALAAATSSPFGPSVHGTLPDTPPAAGKDHNGSPNGEDPATPAVADVVVDAERLGERIIPVPVRQGRYTHLSAVDGALLWLASDPAGVTGEGRASAEEPEQSQRLERFDLSRREVSVLVPALDGYEVSQDRKRIVYVHKAQVKAVPAAGKVDDDSPESVQVDLGRIRVTLEPLKVWGQAFDEAWRLQRDFYWAEDLAGLDWQGVYDRYRPLVERLGSHDDLVDLLWELHGELGTSHAYVSPPPVAEPGSGKQGRLGADLARTEAGWTVRKILAGESSDPLAMSPLTAPGAAVDPGDVIAAVDGIPVDPLAGPAPLLAGAAGKTVELTIVNGAGSPEAGLQRRIAVIPIRDEERLRYQNWVSGNRRNVREASNGRFGYLHIPDMVARGWAQLHRDLDVETAKDALVIDVRRNRGGHTSQLVAELIGRKVTAWNLARGEQPGTYPAHAPRGPVVVLTDEYAGSDGDIITQVSKLRGIGPVVGTRTWGGVVGIDAKFSLADGTGVTQPRYAFWFTQGVGWGVENYGVDPDIEVPFPPHAYGAGEDPQLEHSVGILKEMLGELPTDQPPARAGYPVLRPGPLPPRPQEAG